MGNGRGESENDEKSPVGARQPVFDWAERADRVVKGLI